MSRGAKSWQPGDGERILAPTIVRVAGLEAGSKEAEAILEQHKSRIAQFQLGFLRNWMNGTLDQQWTTREFEDCTLRGEVRFNQPMITLTPKLPPPPPPKVCARIPDLLVIEWVWDDPRQPEYDYYTLPVAVRDYTFVSQIAAPPGWDVGVNGPYYFLGQLITNIFPSITDTSGALAAVSGGTGNYELIWYSTRDDRAPGMATGSGEPLAAISFRPYVASASGPVNAVPSLDYALSAGQGNALGDAFIDTVWRKRFSSVSWDTPYLFNPNQRIYAFRWLAVRYKDILELLPRATIRRGNKLFLGSNPAVSWDEFLYEGEIAPSAPRRAGEVYGVADPYGQPITAYSLARADWSRINVPRVLDGDPDNPTWSVPEQVVAYAVFDLRVILDAEGIKTGRDQALTIDLSGFWRSPRVALNTQVVGPNGGLSSFPPHDSMGPVGTHGYPTREAVYQALFENLQSTTAYQSQSWYYRPVREMPSAPVTIRVTRVWSKDIDVYDYTGYASGWSAYPGAGTVDAESSEEVAVVEVSDRQQTQYFTSPPRMQPYGQDMGSLVLDLCSGDITYNPPKS